MKRSIVYLDADDLATITLAKDEHEIDREDLRRHDGLITRPTRVLESVSRAASSPRKPAQ